MGGTRRSLLKSAFLLLSPVAFVSFAFARAPVAAQAPTASLHGNLSTELSALSGRQIIIYKVSSMSGRLALFQSCATITDSNGNYRCDRLLPGNYLVVAELARLAIDGSQGELPSFSFFPGTTDLNKAITLQLTTDDSQSADFILSPIEAHRINGSLPDKAAVARIRLFTTADNGIEYELPISAEPRDHGAFSFSNVPPGRYVISAEWSDSTREYFASADAVLADHDLSKIVPALDEPADIQLSFASGTTSKVRLPRVSLENVDTGLEVDSVPDTDRASISFGKVKAGSYLLFVSEASDGCIGSISSGAYEVANPIRIDGQASLLRIGATLHNPCGSLRGTLSPATNGDIVLTDEDFNVIRIAKTDSNGAFMIVGLPFGEYMVFAWPNLDEIKYRDRSFLMALKNRCSVVSLSDAEPNGLIEVAPIY